MSKNEDQPDILPFVPSEPDWRIPWEEIESSSLHDWISKLRTTPQNPLWHGEGDVWTHTQMVCEALSGFPEFRSLDERRRQEVFLAALLHDFGKATCTRWENEIWTSPYHGVVGARIAREILWREYGLGGMRDCMEFRETICSLVRHHPTPPHIPQRERPELLLHKIAAGARLTPDFSIDLLLLLEKADITGRIADSTEELLENLELCRYAAEEAGCLQTAISFPNDFSEYAYLSGRGIQPGQQLYDDTWGEVILMSGLPGTGKDTWIRNHCLDLPMISLDEIRSTMKASKASKTQKAAAKGRSQAQEYLRKKTPFVWNATCLTPDIRNRLVSLFESYGARVRIVYLETTWETRRQRNINRKESERVPETVIIDMLRKMSLPGREEAHKVVWECV